MVGDGIMEKKDEETIRQIVHEELNAFGSTVVQALSEMYDSYRNETKKPT